MITYRARWVFPVAAPPIPDGRVSIEGDRIGRVEPAGPADVDLGNVALLPGFVNAHTHLDLSGARGRCPPGPDFTQWLRQVIAFRRERTPQQVQEDIAAGIAECLRFGTTLVGDIASGGASWDLLSRSPLWATVYYELIGLTKERAEQSWTAAEQWLQTHPATSTCKPGLSPHAPYSVRRELFEAVARTAKAHTLAVAIHLAETAEEIELLEHWRGPFVDFLRKLGAWDPHGLVSGCGELLRMYRRVNDVALIHGNFLAASEHTVVTCPRTTFAFGRELFWERSVFQFCGREAFGTDSLASNPDLDILAEARILFRRFKREAEVFWPEQFLENITMAGARVTGWERETGSLAEHKSADLVVLPLPTWDCDDPHELIFDSDAPVRAVMFRGKWVVGEPPA